MREFELGFNPSSASLIGKIEDQLVTERLLASARAFEYGARAQDLQKLIDQSAQTDQRIDAALMGAGGGYFALHGLMNLCIEGARMVRVASLKSKAEELWPTDDPPHQAER